MMHINSNQSGYFNQMGGDYENDANFHNSDEDTRHFLNMLDAAAERVFEAYAEKIAAESSAIHVPPSEQIVQHSPSMLQDIELPSKVSPQNTISPISKLSSFPIEPHIKRKRRRTGEQPDFQQLVDANQINLDLIDKNPSFKKDIHIVCWPQNFTFQSNGLTSSTQGSGPKQPSFYVNNNHRQLPKTSPSRIIKNLSNSGLYALDGNNVEGVREEVEKSVHFSKAIEDAICRIECLIPSLQKLVKPTHSSEQKSVANLGLPEVLSAVKPTGQEKEKDRVITTNELCLSDKSVALGEAILSQQASQMLTKRNFPARSQVKWRKNTEYVESETTQESDLPSSSSESYESLGSDCSNSDESVPLHEKVGQSFTESTESTASGYDDTSSYYNSLDEYSDAGPSSQMSSERGHKWERQREQGKRRGRLRRLGRKLGMIFHHHHHHHHHHYRDEHDVHHTRSFWKRFGAMFHHMGNANHRHNLKDEKPRKSEIKTVVKRKKQGGHFHALLGGLMKHMKHSKPEQVKNGIKGLGSGCNGDLKEGKILPWWSKFRGRRGGVKVSNKGKFRLGNHRTKSFMAAKMILKK